MRQMSPDQYCFSSLAWCDIEEQDKAIELSSVGIEKYPEFADLYRLRSTFYADQKNYPAALKDITKFIDLEPDSSSGYEYRGHLLMQVEHYEEAEYDFKRAIEIDPNSHPPYYQIGIAQLKQGKRDLALPNLRTYLDLRGIQDTDAMLQKIISQNLPSAGDMLNR
ncbi:MAG: tetratricopeptide repeat protein [Chloroflexota bacterium]